MLRVDYMHRLWMEGNDTFDIACIMGVHESVVANALAKRFEELRSSKSWRK